MQTTIQTGSPSVEAIAYCAYMIWEKEGRPVGRDREHWLQAEAMLRASERKPAIKAKRRSIPKVTTALSRAA